MSEQQPDDALLEADRCVKCGLCLPHCPTYRLYADENESPRGRIALAEALLRGQLPADSTLGDHLYRCLLCRRCETVCPSGVHYGRLMDAARARMPRSHWSSRLAAQPRLGRLLADAGRWLPVPGSTLSALARALPVQTAAPAPGVYPPTGTSRGRIGLFLGCVTRSHQGNALQAALQLLIRLGYTVVIPAEQACRGALALHQGEPDTASELARRNAAAFTDSDTLVSVASGCAAHLREHLSTPASRDILGFLRDDAAWSQLTFTPLEATAALHRPCSAVNSLREPDSAQLLLGAIPGLDLRLLGTAGECCGAAGDHLLTEREQALALRKPLLQQLAGLGADFLLSSNIGCALHLAEGAGAQGLRLATLHPVELLARQLTPNEAPSRGCAKPASNRLPIG